MSRGGKIRVTKNDVKEFKRLAKNVKSKIARTQKKYGVDLSSEIPLPKGVESFTTRKEFNAWKRQAEDLTNRSNTRYQFKKNKYGVVASVAEINKAKRDAKRAQRVAKKLIAEAAKKDYHVKGRKVSTVGQRMQQMGKNAGEIHVPPDFNFDAVVSRRHFKEKIENLEERSDLQFFDKRVAKLKQNYIKSLETHYNSLADEAIALLNKIPDKDFYDMFLQHDELQFDFEYTEEQTEANINKKISIFTRYMQQNNDLKIF